jgi:hypothetical protein
MEKPAASLHVSKRSYRTTEAQRAQRNLMNQAQAADIVVVPTGVVFQHGFEGFRSKVSPG